MVVLSAESATLEITIVGADFEPSAAGRVEDSIIPGIYVDFSRVLSNGIDIGCEPNVGLAVDIDKSEADGEVLVMMGVDLDRCRVFGPRFGPGTDLHDIE